MTKKYKARTILAFTVAGKRVEFTGHSEGGSYYVTGDAELMEGMEKHSWYGKKFWIEEVRGAAAMGAPAPAAETGGEAPETVAKTEDETFGNGGEEGAASAEVESVTHFDTRGEAAAWLRDTFGIASSKLKTISGCIELAAGKGMTITIG